MMQRFERAMRTNMASAERDMRNKPEDRRGFVIGATKQLWETYHQHHQINEEQFDQLIELLSTFAQGSYRSFIAEMVRDYKSGKPPIIIGY